MSLLALQRDMRAWLVHADMAAATRIQPSAEPGFAVYQNNYRSQLVACLESSFARTRAWIGEDRFLQAAVHHIDDVPPSSWTLDAYAHDFPVTLARLYPDDEEIPEIACLELGLEELFVSADSPAVRIDRLNDVEWDRAVLTFQRSIDLVALKTNAFVIWSALGAGEEPPASRYLNTPETALLWRQDEQCRIRIIDASELCALLDVRSGMAFGQVCRNIMRRFGEEHGVALIGQWLALWLSTGMIAAIDDQELQCLARS
ncbi:DNA-binding domain-containing protein [Sphingobium olei]|uniref:DNA-binding domain-containing protein n=1 Tax=Sphingobium olei TaxID=420955 RepID=A0ABW3P4W3_9SPHN|nr:putative DNA-binding domain-containing protein [Sphingobium sp.]